MIEWIVTSGILIALVLCIRLVLQKKLTPRLQYSLWLLVLLIGSMLGCSWFFLLTYQPPNNGLMMAALMVLTVLFSSVITFVFALQARYENSVLLTLKNAWILSIGKLFSGLLMSFVNLFPIIMFMVNLDVFVNVVAIWIPLGFALQMQINALILRRILFKLEAAQQEIN